MPNLERKQIEVGCGETELCGDYLSLDEVRAILANFEKEQGATHCYFYETTDRCGDHESYQLCFVKYREETDEEYNKRIERETDYEQEKAREQKRRGILNLQTEIRQMEKELATTPDSIKALNEELANLPNRIEKAKKDLETLLK